MADGVTDLAARVSEVVGDRAAEWDRAGLLPVEVRHALATEGLLCPQTPARYGGLGLNSRDAGELTAHAGSLCSSVRSVMTSQQMVAGSVERLGDEEQRARYLPRLAGGEIAAAAFSEPGAGSDLSAMATTIRAEGDTVVVDGRKTWITTSVYADLLLVFGRFGDAAAAVVIPADAPGVTVDRIPDPLGCRAAGHADLVFDGVRVPVDAVLGGTGLPLPLLVTAALTHGRMSVAWGCVGILRSCLAEATRHARTREQFGVPIGRHQLVARHLAETYTAERIATHACEHASDRWDAGSPDMVAATVLAKHVSAAQAVSGSYAALQVLASAGARDGHAVARAHRDARLMEIIEGSSEMCTLILADHVLATAG
ncbi:acyl-CoA dehydrogenase [Nocardiopsis sp. CNR-923]|uniref:acyl-CoA dehydrogenase family protein n=1 Tax=Nocardiopsis sp. CNR-923 TaxID=1904965 RepID=UPI0009625456|nr:acyl-CoA dehydrogenase family protein [Nocardiopsis sp. CNR-923]OLT24651.1 acyl-CoA dehydrogenase [Nocardiopsis sp. CNR-923]